MVKRKNLHWTNTFCVYPTSLSRCPIFPSFLASGWSNNDTSEALDHRYRVTVHSSMPNWNLVFKTMVHIQWTTWQKRTCCWHFSGDPECIEIIVIEFDLCWITFKTQRNSIIKLPRWPETWLNTFFKKCSWQVEYEEFNFSFPKTIWTAFLSDDASSAF